MVINGEKYKMVTNNKIEKWSKGRKGERHKGKPTFGQRCFVQKVFCRKVFCTYPNRVLSLNLLVFF